METKIMKKRNIFNVVCLVRKNRVLKNAEFPVFVRITMNGSVADIPIAGSAKPSQRNQSQGKTRGNSREAQELNHNIQYVKSRKLQIYRDIEIDTKPISAQIIKDIYLGNNTDEDSKTLIEVHTDHNER